MVMMTMCPCDTKKSENSAARNRADHPETASVIDLFRKYFGDDVKVIYSTLDGKLIGKITPEPTHFVTVDRWLWQTRTLVLPELERREIKPMLKSTAAYRRGAR
jgi:hypothetical protein